MNVSVVITTYNRYHLFKRALNSVLKQTYKPFEVIVVEDGSNSGVEACIKKNHFSYIKYIRHNENKGLAYARNAGFRVSHGDWIAYLDDDDEWENNKLEKQIHKLKNIIEYNKNNIGYINCGARIINNNSQTKFSVPKIKGNIKENIIRGGISSIPSSYIFSVSVLKEVGGFDENLISSIDHDIIMSLAKAGYYAYALDEPLVITYERTGRTTMMTNTEKRIRGVELFIDKWRSTFYKWFGKTKGDRFINRYYARVIGMLLDTKLSEGDYKSAFCAARMIYSKSRAFLYNTYLILKILFKKLI